MRFLHLNLSISVLEDDVGLGELARLKRVLADDKLLAVLAQLGG